MTSAGRLALVLVGLVAAAALVVGIVGLMRTPATPINYSAPPAFTADDAARAKNSLCTAWSVASIATRAETNRNNPALARIALTNSAAIVEAAAQNPALPSHDKAAATSLSEAYRLMTAVSSTAAPTTPEFQAASERANQAAREMQVVCA